VRDETFWRGAGTVYRIADVTCRSAGDALTFSDLG
jgi:hypothetical protein